MRRTSVVGSLLLLSLCYPSTAWSQLPSCAFWGWYLPTPAGNQWQPEAPAPIDVSELQPGDAELLYTKGQAFYWAGNFQSALNYFQAASQLNPGDARYWTYLALTENRLGNADNAKKAGELIINFLIRQSPDLPTYRRTLELIQAKDREFIRQYVFIQ